jgi:hypothetical protein
MFNQGDFVKQIRRHFTYANVMSSIAVFMILGGATAMAAKVGTGQLKAGSVKTGKIAKEAVKAGKLAKNSVTTAKVANSSITSEKLADGSVTTTKLANGAVTGEKLAAGAVSRANIAGANFVPRAYALVDFEGKTISGFTDGIPNATLTGTEGVYCFDLAFSPVHAQATGEADGEGNDLASVAIAGANEGLENCPDGTDVEVEMWDTGGDTETEEDFFLVVW